MASDERTAELTHDFPSSVEVNVGMTGNVGWSIKLRSIDGDEMQMVARIHELHDELTNRFKKTKDDTIEKLEASIERVNETKSTRRPTAPAGSAQAVSDRLGKAIETAKRAQENYPT